MKSDEAIAEVWQARCDWWQAWMWRGMVGVVIAGSIVVVLLLVLDPYTTLATPVMVGTALIGVMWGVISFFRADYANKQAAEFRAGITMPTGAIR